MPLLFNHTSHNQQLQQKDLLANYSPRIKREIVQTTQIGAARIFYHTLCSMKHTPRLMRAILVCSALAQMSLSV